MLPSVNYIKKPSIISKIKSTKVPKVPEILTWLHAQAKFIAHSVKNSMRYKFRIFYSATKNVGTFGTLVPSSPPFLPLVNYIKNPSIISKIKSTKVLGILYFGTFPTPFYAAAGGVRPRVSSAVCNSSQYENPWNQSSV